MSDHECKHRRRGECADCRAELESFLGSAPTRLHDGEPCSHRGCLNHVSHPCDGCGRIAGRAPQPAEPTGAKNEDAIRGKAFIAGWLSGETHGSTHGVALGYEELRAKAEATANRYVDAHKSANLNKPITPLASHPAEPQRLIHSCPRCGAACICAEGFDGDPCQHFRIGCKSAAPAEPERGTACDRMQPSTCRFAKGHEGPCGRPVTETAR